MRTDMIKLAIFSIMCGSSLMALSSTFHTPINAATNATQQEENATAMANQTFDPTANLSSIPTSPNQPDVMPGS